MKAFFRFFAERHLLANLLTIMVLLMGVFSLLRINRSELPKVDYGVMTVITHYPGASAEDVELNVTNKIEDELKTVTGIKRLISASVENHSGIQAIIDPNVSDTEKVKQNIREAVARVTSFPPEVTDAPQVIEEDSNEPILEVGMTGDDMPYAELREYARIFEKKLKAIPGISKITKEGYRAREVQIEVSPDNMMKYRIPLQQIISAIKRRNIRSSGGSLESYTSEKNVLTLAQFREPQDVGDVIVHASPEGAMVRVKDLAVIHDDFEKERYIPRINGHATISFIVTKSENADIVRTGDAVKRLVQQEQERLPDGSGIEFVYTTDESTYIRNRFDIVRSNGLIGLILVLLVLALFLNLRASFWVALGIPFTLLGVLVLLPVVGSDLDGVTLTAMVVVIGIIVDDAIVISENIFRRREQGDAPLEAAIHGIHEVYLPVLTTIITTFLAFLPMFFMKGELGLFVRVVPITISLALALSLFESFLLLPAHLLTSLKAARNTTRNFGRAWFHPIRNLFEKLMHTILHLRYLWLLSAIGLLAGCVWYASNFMGFVLFPAKGADLIYGRLRLPVGASLQATTDVVKELEAILDNFPDGEILSHSFSIGAGQFFGSENSANIQINLTPYATRQHEGKRTAEEIADAIRLQAIRLAGIEQLTFEVYSRGVDSGKPIEIRIVGSDDRLRKALTDDVVAFLADIRGVKDIARDDIPGKDEVTITINHERLALYGLTVEDIAQNVRVAYDGEVVTSVRYGEDDVEFRLMIEKLYRQEADYLRQLRIPSAAGHLITLHEVASLEIAPGVSAFFHFDGERAVTITADVSQEMTTPMAVMEAGLNHFTQEKLNTEYPGIRFASGGEAEESRKAMLDLYGTFALAALGIYFLLMLLFNSVIQPLIVILSIPFGICGIIIAFALHGEPFSFLGMMGVIGMAGVVVNDSLVLVDHLNSLSGNRRNPDGSPATRMDMLSLIAAGTANRLRPILLTTLTTIAGLLPLTYGIGGHDIYMGPMAMSLGYGLLFATPVTLILIPSLYLIGYDIRAALTNVTFVNRKQPTYAQKKTAYVANS